MQQDMNERWSFKKSHTKISKKIKRTLIISLVFFIIFSASCFSANVDIDISEVLFDAVGDDNDKEFVEFRINGICDVVIGSDGLSETDRSNRSNTSNNFSSIGVCKNNAEDLLNVSDWTVGDLQGNDTLSLLKKVNSSYFLIVEEGFNHSKINATIYSAGKAIGNGLSNQEDAVFIYDENGTEISSFRYDSNGGEGYSIGVCNGSKRFMSPTSGDINDCSDGQSETDMGEDYELKFDIVSDKQIFVDEKITFKFDVQKDLDYFEIEYWVEDEDGDIVKEKRTTASTSKKQFTPDDRLSGTLLHVKAALKYQGDEIKDSFPVFYKQANIDRVRGTTKKIDFFQKENQFYFKIQICGSFDPLFLYLKYYGDENESKMSQNIKIVRKASGCSNMTFSLDAGSYCDAKRISLLAEHELLQEYDLDFNKLDCQIEENNKKKEERSCGGDGGAVDQISQQAQTSAIKTQNMKGTVEDIHANSSALYQKMENKTSKIQIKSKEDEISSSKNEKEAVSDYKMWCLFGASFILTLLVVLLI